MRRKKKKETKRPALVLPRQCAAQDYEGHCWFKDAICIHCEYNPLAKK